MPLKEFPHNWHKCQLTHNDEQITFGSSRVKDQGHCDLKYIHSCECNFTGTP